MCRKFRCDREFWKFFRTKQGICLIIMFGGIQDDSNLVWLPMRIIPRYEPVLSFLFGWSHDKSVSTKVSIWWDYQHYQENKQENRRSIRGRTLLMHRLHLRHLHHPRRSCTSSPPKTSTTSSRLPRRGHTWSSFSSCAAQRHVVGLYILGWLVGCPKHGFAVRTCKRQQYQTTYSTSPRLPRSWVTLSSAPHVEGWCHLPRRPHATPCCPGSHGKPDFCVSKPISWQPPMHGSSASFWFSTWNQSLDSAWYDVGWPFGWLHQGYQSCPKVLLVCSKK
jgi:hypothetical protein